MADDRPTTVDSRVPFPHGAHHANLTITGWQRTDCHLPLHRVAGPGASSPLLNSAIVSSCQLRDPPKVPIRLLTV
jgi:hypothetical protein